MMKKEVAIELAATVLSTVPASLLIAALADRVSEAERNVDDLTHLEPDFAGEETACDQETSCLGGALVADGHSWERARAIELAIQATSGPMGGDVMKLAGDFYTFMKAA